MGNLLEQLKQRGVYRATAVYAVTAWLLIQIADVVLPTFQAPLWLNQAVILVLLLGFPLVILLAWTFDMSLGGIRITEAPQQHEAIRFRKRDYAFAFSVLLLATLVISQQVYLLTQGEEPVNAEFSQNNAGSTAPVPATTAPLAEIFRLVEQGDNFQAFFRANELVSRQPDNEALAELWDDFSTPATVLTEPAGMKVWFKEYAKPASEWHFLGETPIENVRLPDGYLRLKVQQGDSNPVELLASNPFPLFGNYALRPGFGPFPVHIRSPDFPQDMVFIPSGTLPNGIQGFEREQVHLEDFLIDRYEVSNRQFKEFVDQGGYQNPDYWLGLEFVDNGQILEFQQAVARFVDSTGRPGPASWELGDYPAGQENFPVTGVSWYEAEAYARFRGKVLPTVYHWARAAYYGFFSGPIIPQSNFSGVPLPVDDARSASPIGAYNMPGNAREWVWNSEGSNRWAMGGSWADEFEYMANLSYNLPPMVRDQSTGFRLARYLDENSVDAELLDDPSFFIEDFSNKQPVSDDVYTVFVNQFSYSSENLAPIVESSDDGHPDWRVETVTLDADYAEERFAVYLFTPRTAVGPFDAVIYAGGSNTFSGSAQSPAASSISRFDFILNSGRAFVVPVYSGSFERYDGLNESPENEQVIYRQRLYRWRSDLGRTLDYLETRGDINNESVAFLGISYGASAMTPLLALEQRLKVAVLIIGGFTFRDFPEIADPLNYVGHIVQPVLMLNGRYDPVFPVETRQLPFFDKLGTPASEKRHVLFDTAHRPPPRGPLVRETIDWLDRYQ